MKLDRIETFVVANPPPRHGGRYFIFVRLTTACGISGVGESTMPHSDPTFARRWRSICSPASSRPGSASHRTDVAPQLWCRLHDAARRDGLGRAERPGNGLLGHYRQGRWPAGSTSCWADQVHRRLRSSHYLYPPQGDVYPDPHPSQRLQRPRPCGRGGAACGRAGLYRP